MTPRPFARFPLRLTIALAFALAPFAFGAAEEADDSAPPPPATLTPPAKKKKAPPPVAEEGGEETPAPPAKKKAPPAAEEGGEEGSEETPPAEEGGEEGSATVLSKPVPGEKILADFEEADGKFKGVIPRDGATAEAAGAHAAHGSKACHLKFTDPPGKSSLRFSLLPLEAQDWSKFKFLQMNAFNPGAVPGDLLLRVFDGTNMTSCTVTLPPKAAQAIKVPVSTFSARSEISAL
ncbi:MAG: hypothetical protein AAB215_05810, partial [Planctomycetota bacterium]